MKALFEPISIWTPGDYAYQVILTMKRSSVVGIFGGLFLVNIVAFSQTNGAVATPGWSLTDFAAVIGIIASLVTGLMFVATLVWYVLQGKNREQLKEHAEGWKDTADRLRGQLADARVDAATETAARIALEKDNDLLRKANLRLQGLSDQA